MPLAGPFTPLIFLHKISKNTSKSLIYDRFRWINSFKPHLETPAAPHEPPRFLQSSLTEWGLGCGWAAQPPNHTPKSLFFCRLRRESGRGFHKVRDFVKALHEIPKNRRLLRGKCYNLSIAIELLSVSVP